MKRHQKLSLKKQAKLYCNKKAQFLSESILGLMVFLIIFFGFVNLIIAYFSQIKYANERIVANFLALSSLEEIQGYKEFINTERKCASLWTQGLGESICTTTVSGINSSSPWVYGLIDENSDSISTEVCLNYDFSTSSCDNPGLYLKDNFYSYDNSGTSTIFTKKLTIRCNFNPVNCSGMGALANATAVEAISEIEFGNNPKNKINLKMIFITK